MKSKSSNIFEHVWGYFASISMTIQFYLIYNSSTSKKMENVDNLWRADSKSFEKKTSAARKKDDVDEKASLVNIKTRRGISVVTISSLAIRSLT